MNREFQYETPVGTFEAWEAAANACERCDLDAVECIKASRIAGEAVTVVAARLVEDARLVKVGQIDIGKPHTFETYMRPESLMWLNKGTAEDVAKARKWAEANGYEVFVYPISEKDPLGRARADVSAG